MLCLFVAFISGRSGAIVSSFEHRFGRLPWLGVVVRPRASCLFPSCDQHVAPVSRFREPVSSVRSVLGAGCIDRFATYLSLWAESRFAGSVRPVPFTLRGTRSPLQVYISPRSFRVLVIAFGVISCCVCSSSFLVLRRGACSCVRFRFSCRGNCLRGSYSNPSSVRWSFDPLVTVCLFTSTTCWSQFNSCYS